MLGDRWSATNYIPGEARIAFSWLSAKPPVKVYRAMDQHQVREMRKTSLSIDTWHGDRHSSGKGVQTHPGHDSHRLVRPQLASALHRDAQHFAPRHSEKQQSQQLLKHFTQILQGVNTCSEMLHEIACLGSALSGFIDHPVGPNQQDMLH